MKVLIITGGSKGIGKSLVNKYHKEGYLVHSIARSKIKNIDGVFHHAFDLSDSTGAAIKLKEIVTNIDLNTISNITLINNAGSLGEISNIENNNTDSIQKTIALNLSTPLVLSGLFINVLKNFSFRKNIINISSGAAIKPYEGWSVYCSSKAGLDMATKTIASEQSTALNPTKINAIYPGVVETGMQVKIRDTTQANFKNVQRFIDLKKEDKLFSTEFVAAKIFNLDVNNRLENGAIVDIRNL